MANPRDLPDGARVLLMELEGMSDAAGVVLAGVREIAAHARKAPNTVQDALNNYLIPRGFVVRAGDGKLVLCQSLIQPKPVRAMAVSGKSATIKNNRKNIQEPRSYQKLTQLTERRTVVMQFCRELGVQVTPDLKRYALGKLTRLLASFTAEDVLAVAAYCRAEYNRGDRFKALLNPMYILSPTQFPALLAALRTTPPYRREHAGLYGTDEERDDLQRRIAGKMERGEM